MTRRYLVFIAFGLVLLSLLAAGALLARLSDPGLLAADLRELLLQNTSIDMHIRGGGRFTLFPRPALILDDVTFVGADGRAQGHVAQIRCRPSLRGLLAGSMRLSRLELIQPDVTWEVPFALPAWGSDQAVAVRGPGGHGHTGHVSGTGIAPSPRHPAADGPALASSARRASPRISPSAQGPLMVATRSSAGNLVVPVAASSVSSAGGPPVHAGGDQLPTRFPRTAVFGTGSMAAEAQTGIPATSDAALTPAQTADAPQGGYASVSSLIRLPVDRVLVTDGRLALHDPAGTVLNAHGVGMDATLSEGTVRFALDVKTVELSGASGAFARFRDARLELDDLSFMLDGKTVTPATAGSEPAAQVVEGESRASVTFSLRGSLDAETRHVRGTFLFAGRGGIPSAGGTVRMEAAQLEAKGTVLLAGVAVPFEVDAPFSVADGGTLTLTDALLRLDGDSGRLDARCYGLGGALPVMEGRLRLAHLSLPRWFGFARRLPPGLQHALDGLQGVLDFKLTPSGVDVPRLEARVYDIPLLGRGAVTSFAEPVIYIEAAAPSIDVNKVVPEVAGTFPAAPKHDGPAPVPVPGTEAAKAMSIPDVGYDIRIHADAAKVRGFDVRQLDFRCAPSAGGTMLTFASPDAYGGKVRADLDIAGDYTLKAQVRGMDSKTPASIVAGREVLSGVIDGDLSLKARGAGLSNILASLSGSVDIGIAEGRIAAREFGKPVLQGFSQLKLRAQASGQGLDEGKPLPQRLAWNGTWQVHWQRPDGSEGDFELTGPVLFSMKTGLPVACPPTPCTFRLRFPREGSGAVGSLDMQTASLFSFDDEKQTVAFKDVTGKAEGGLFSGAVHVTSRGESGEQWVGTLEASHPNLRRLLALWGKRVWETASPEVLGAARLRSGVRYTREGLEFPNLDAMIDDSRITGEIRRFGPVRSEVRPQWRFDLKADRLNADSYLPPVQREAPPSEEPWNLEWMRNFDAEGRLLVAEAIYRQQPMTRVVVPVSLRSGVLEVIPGMANFSGGRLTVSLRAEAGDALDTRLRFDAVDFDLQPLVVRHWARDHLGGKTRLSFDVHGVLARDADIPRAFDGTWGFEVREGYYSLRGADAPEGVRTPFSLAKATGSMRRGVLHNDDFILSSLLMSMTGKGWVDLATRRIDYTTDIALVKVPNLPIRFHGDLAAPKATVRELGIVTGTIGNIGSGIFGLLEGVLTAPLKVLDALGKTPGTPQDGSSRGRTVSPPMEGAAPRP